MLPVLQSYVLSTTSILPLYSIVACVSQAKSLDNLPCWFPHTPLDQLWPPPWAGSLNLGSSRESPKSNQNKRLLPTLNKSQQALPKVLNNCQDDIQSPPAPFKTPILSVEILLMRTTVFTTVSAHVDSPERQHFLNENAKQISFTIQLSFSHPKLQHPLQKLSKVTPERLPKSNKNR